jgi:hypothetical protein
MILKFKVRKGKFKPIKVYDEIEDLESCSVCFDEEKCGEECYYLTNEAIQLQLCKECFEECEKLQEKK